jgi:hypothetical protein
MPEKASYVTQEPACLQIHHQLNSPREVIRVLICGQAPKYLHETPLNCVKNKAPLCPTYLQDAKAVGLQNEESVFYGQYELPQLDVGNMKHIAGNNVASILACCRVNETCAELGT